MTDYLVDNSVWLVYAILNDATVLAADRDFDHIAQVTDLKQEYIAPSI